MTFAPTLAPTPPAATAPLAGIRSAPGPRPGLAANKNLYDAQVQPFPTAGKRDNKLESTIRAMQRSMHLQPSRLSEAFFSAVNVDAIQGRIKDVIKRQTGYAIDRQSDDALLAVMRHVYVRDSVNVAPDVAAEVARLNAHVVKEAAPIVASGLAQFLSYVRDASQIPDPLPRAQQTSIKGTKTASMFRPL